MAIYEYKGTAPKISKTCFIAPSSDIIGDVEIDEGSSVWFNATLRADLNSIRIGKHVSVQDNCVIHTDKKTGTEISDHVVIGHRSVVHSAKIGSHTIIGMGSVLLSGCRIGKNCIIGAGSLVTEGVEIPENSIAVGSPAKVVKQVSEEHMNRIRDNIQEYIELNNTYLKSFKKLV